MATWPINISKLVLSGTLPRNDIWSIGIYIDDGGKELVPQVPGGAQAFEAIRDAAIIWFTSSQARISRNARLMSVKLNQIGTNGKYKNPYTNELIVGSGSGAAGGVPSDGWQHLSMAITHRTDVARGPASSGRVFPPAVIINPTSQGLPDDEQVASYASAWTGFLNAVYAAVPGELAGTALVVSTGTKAAPNVGVRRNISRVEVGNIIDVQQRRRNALPEKYVRSVTNIQFPAAAGGGTSNLGQP